LPSLHKDGNPNTVLEGDTLDMLGSEGQRIGFGVYTVEQSS